MIKEQGQLQLCKQVECDFYPASTAKTKPVQIGSIRIAVKALSATSHKADFLMAIDLIHLA